MAATIPDSSQEESSQGMTESVKYVARMFLDKSHYQTIHETLSSKWDRLHSLSAAVRLMANYGVTLTPEEETLFSKVEEEEDKVKQQINALVSKMPQGNDQFQHFFLQLQLLVSTAMRVRRSLEEGRPDEVEQALDDAQTTGIASYILRVAIVQAGNEVVQLRKQYKAWTLEADAKMGRLLRGQQDALAAQKKLAAAEAELQRNMGLQNEKTAKAVMAFAGNNSKAILSMSFSSWGAVTKQEKMEREIRAEYASRMENVELRLLRWKEGQLRTTRSTMMKRIEEEQAVLAAFIFKNWRTETDERKFDRENGEKVKALEDRLAGMKAQQLDNTRSVMRRFSMAGDRTCLDVAYQSWLAFHKEEQAAKEAVKAQRAAAEKLSKLTKSKSENAKKILESMTGATDTGLVHMFFQGWVSVWEDAKREAQLAEIMNKTNTKLSSFSMRNKDTNHAAMIKARHHIEHMLLLRCLNAWRLDCKMERTMRFYNAKMDAKRQQLVGVQHMFRKFAQELESGLKEGSTASRGDTKIFDVVDRDRDRGERRGMRRSEHTVSLPDINQKPSSGRSSIKSMTSGKNVGGAYPTGPDGTPVAVGKGGQWG